MRTRAFLGVALLLLAAAVPATAQEPAPNDSGPPGVVAPPSVDSLRNRLGWLRGSIRGAETNATAAIAQLQRLEAGIAELAANRAELEALVESLLRVDGPLGSVRVELGDRRRWVAITTRPDGTERRDTLAFPGP